MNTNTGKKPETGNKQLHYKLVLVGASGVGKSSLVSRYINNKFEQNPTSTVGVSYMTKVVKVNDGWENFDVKFDIWDTAGQERYHSLSHMYYRNSQAAIVVYSITDDDSFKRAQKWVKELREECKNGICIALAGNKVDLPNRQVTAERARAFAEAENLFFLETSALTAHNVAAIFEAIAARLPKMKIAAEKKEPDRESVVLTNIDPKASKPCCGK